MAKAELQIGSYSNSAGRPRSNIHMDKSLAITIANGGDEASEVLERIAAMVTRKVEKEESGGL